MSAGDADNQPMMDPNNLPRGPETEAEWQLRDENRLVDNILAFEGFIRMLLGPSRKEDIKPARQKLAEAMYGRPLTTAAKDRL